MANQKNLNLSSLKKMNNQLNKTQRIHLDDNYYIDIDTVFRTTKIQLILERLLEVNQYITDNKIEKFDIISYSLFLAIKEFTSLKIEDDLNVELQALNMIIDLGYFNKIIESFGEDNIKLFLDKLIEALKNVSLIQNELVKEIMKNEEIIDNKIDNIENIGDGIEIFDDKVNLNVVDLEEGDKNSQPGSTVENTGEEVTE